MVRMRNRERMAAGGEWGRVRALVRAGQATVEAASPSKEAAKQRRAVHGFHVTVPDDDDDDAPAGLSQASSLAPSLVPSPAPTPVQRPSSARLLQRKSTLRELCSRIQLLQERDELGQSMIDKCNSIIDQSTKRCYTEEREPYFRVTVTDFFGGRGHDFDCLSEHANSQGGMLLTSPPSPTRASKAEGAHREVDRPGSTTSSSQQRRALRQRARPRCEAAQAARQADHRRAATAQRQGDRGPLGGFEQQARGAWANEMCEAYYRAHGDNLTRRGRRRR